MLAYNLIANCTLIPPSKVIHEIEAVKPAGQPRLSPLPEVRRRWQLEHMDVGDLRKTVLDRHRKGREEKEWLIRILISEVKDNEGVEDEAGKSTKPHFNRIERRHQRRRPKLNKDGQLRKVRSARPPLWK